MKRYDVCQLISESPTAHGVFDTATETATTVFCEIKSATRNEAYQSMAVGANASVVFVLSVDADYNNQKEVSYNNTRYRVIRTYLADDGIELVCEVKNG